jgi:hypothetical protein
VTFKHRGFWLGSGKPKAPTIHRLRLDKTWDEIVASFQENNRITPSMFSVRYMHDNDAVWIFHVSVQAFQEETKRQNPL